MSIATRILPLVLTVTYAYLFGFTVTHAAISQWQKGATIVPSTTTDFGSDLLRQSLDRLKATGANFVSLVVPYYQADIYATTIAPGANTPTDEALAYAVNYAHSIGLMVSVKIDIETYDRQWRAYINPTDRKTWFTNYGNVLAHYGSFATAHSVEEMIIGTELIKMASDRENPTNTAYWKSMIDTVRGLYAGKLTYGANWGDGGVFAEEVNQIKFWDKLDYIGVSAYYWLAPQTQGVASIEDLRASWEDWDLRKLKSISEEWNKPILFTEVGYRSHVGAHNEPWNWWSNNSYSDDEQSNDYTALFSYWNTRPYMHGVLLWAWEIDPSATGTGTLGYTPQNKRAEHVMREWFTNPPSANPVDIAFQVKGGVHTATARQPTTIAVSVKNNAAGSVDALIDLEIFNPSYQKIQQRFFQSQHFSPGEEKIFELSWTPESAATYPIMVGIFNNDWTKNYLWESNAGSVLVSDTANSGNTPPAETSIDVWWPSNAAVVSGTQPFKAIASNRPVDTYLMYWSADDVATLYPMETSTTDWPHKEARVPVWQWKTGTHSITFTATDADGAVLGKKTLDITVSP